MIQLDGNIMEETILQMQRTIDSLTYLALGFIILFLVMGVMYYQERKRHDKLENTFKTLDRKHRDLFNKHN